MRWHKSRKLEGKTIFSANISVTRLVSSLAFFSTVFNIFAFSTFKYLASFFFTILTLFSFPTIKAFFGSFFTVFVISCWFAKGALIFHFLHWFWQFLLAHFGTKMNVINPLPCIVHLRYVRHCSNCTASKFKSACFLPTRTLKLLLANITFF